MAEATPDIPTREQRADRLLRVALLLLDAEHLTDSPGFEDARRDVERRLMLEQSLREVV